MVPKTVVDGCEAYRFAREAPRPRVAPIMRMLGIFVSVLLRGQKSSEGGKVGREVKEKEQGAGRFGHDVMCPRGCEFKNQIRLLSGGYLRIGVIYFNHAVLLFNAF